MEKEWDLKARDVSIEISVFAPVRNHTVSAHKQSTNHHEKNLFVSTISFRSCQLPLNLHEKISVISPEAGSGLQQKPLPIQLQESKSNLWDLIISLQNITLPVIQPALPCGA